MPKINTYTRQRLPSEFTNVRATPEMFGSGINDAIDQLGAVISEINEKRERADYVEKLTEFKLQSLERANELSQMDMPLDQISDTYRADYEERWAAFEETVPNSQRDNARLDNSDMMLSFVSTGMKDQVARAASYAKEQAKNVRTTKENIIAMDYTNDATFNDMMGTAGDIAAGIKDPSLRKSYTEETKDVFRKRRAESFVENDPAEFLRRYKAQEDWIKDLPNAGDYRDRAVDALESEAKNLTSKIQKALAPKGGGKQGRKDAAGAAVLAAVANGEDISDPNSPTGFDISRSIQLQSELGVGYQGIRILPQEVADVKAAELNEIPNVTEFQQSYTEYIESFEPEYRGMVEKELAETGNLSPHLQVYLQTDDTDDVKTRQAIFEMRVPDHRDEIISMSKTMLRADNEGESAIDNAVLAETDAYFQAQRMKGNTAVANEKMRKVLTDVAHYYYSQGGMKPQQAAQKATEWLTDKASVASSKHGNVIVPTTESVNPRDVERGMSIAKDLFFDTTLKNIGVDYPTGYNRDDGTRQLYIDHLREHGQWVSNETNTGAILTLFDQPVLYEDGRVVEFSNETLSKMKDIRKRGAKPKVQIGPLMLNDEDREAYKANEKKPWIRVY